MQQIEELFNETLVTQKTYSLDFELKDNLKPICSRPYPVLKLHKKCKKYVKHLVLLVVLERENVSEWGASYFVQPKPRIIQVCLLSDYINLN